MTKTNDNIPATTIGSKPLGTRIVGLSDERQFPRAGKLRIGETVIKCPSCKEPNPVHEMDNLENPTCFKCDAAFNMDLTDAYMRRKQGYPRAHEYFRFAAEPGFEHLADRFNEAYGEKPKLITAYLPLWPTGKGTPNYGQVIRQLFYQSYQFWGASGKKCEGDGVVAKRLNKVKEYEAVECLGRNCKAFARGDCKIRATLNLFLPCFGQPVITQIDTGSPNNIVKINSALELLYAMTAGKMYQPIGLSVTIAKTRKGQAPFINVVWPKNLELEMSEMVIDRNLLAAREGTEMLALPEPGQPELEDTHNSDLGNGPDTALQDREEAPVPIEPVVVDTPPADTGKPEILEPDPGGGLSGSDKEPEAEPIAPGDGANGNAASIARAGIIDIAHRLGLEIGNLNELIKAHIDEDAPAIRKLESIGKLDDADVIALHAAILTDYAAEIAEYNAKAGEGEAGPDGKKTFEERFGD